MGVEDDQFWNGLEALEFGSVPQLEEDVVCVGFPTGGDNISVTRGVVSRVDISRYSYSGIDLLAVQVLYSYSCDVTCIVTHMVLLYTVD